MKTHAATIEHIHRDEWLRDPVAIFPVLQSGRSIFVEDHGRPQAAIVDPLEHQILLAIVRYFIQRPRVDPQVGLPDAALTQLEGQARFNLVVAHYLAGSISLSRAAEILGVSYLELREKVSRLGVPLRTAPRDENEVRQDILVAQSSLARE